MMNERRTLQYSVEKKEARELSMAFRSLEKGMMKIGLFEHIELKTFHWKLKGSVWVFTVKAVINGLHMVCFIEHVHPIIVIARALDALERNEVKWYKDKFHKSNR
ncbi:MAG: hypothetical protein [Circular genetic element sp.]|nr:MAG: hypothetical protein [Circular genetic element sp.]AXQ65328.1 MAG: hypothetical protein [Circular genetic element sp.]